MGVRMSDKDIACVNADVTASASEFVHEFVHTTESTIFSPTFKLGLTFAVRQHFSTKLLEIEVNEENEHLFSEFSRSHQSEFLRAISEIDLKNLLLTLSVLLIWLHIQFEWLK